MYGYQIKQNSKQILLGVASQLGTKLAEAAVLIGIGLALAFAGVTTPSQGASRAAVQAEGRNIIVTCTSGIGPDIGPCLPQAIGRCKGRTQLLGALSSTYLPANKLYQISAQYRFIGG
jgi:hypothetical protein